MLLFTRQTNRATPTVTKIVCLALSIGVVVLSAVCRPTELQEELIEIVWREDGLYILGMVGIAYSAISAAIFALTDLPKRFVLLKILDIVLHFVGCMSFLFCGAAVLYSTLIIMTQIQNCCRAYYGEMVACELDGFIDGIVLRSQKYSELPVPISKFKLKAFNSGVSLPDEISYCIPNKQNPSPDHDWDCTTCINKEVQPFYALKGAAGALGILTSIFYLVVSIVSVSEMKRLKKEAGRINAGLRRSVF